MTIQNDVCNRASEDVSRVLRDAPAVVATIATDDTARHIYWSGASCSVEDLEAVASALLTTAIEERTAAGKSCAGCAERADALRQALALFAPEALQALDRTQARPAHLH